MTALPIRVPRPRAVRPSWVQLALVGYYAAYVLWYYLGGTEGPARTFVSDVAYLPLDAAGVVLSLVAALRTRRRRDRTVWLLVCAALASRLWGDAAWWWLEAVQGVEPFPSTADVGFFLFYPIATVALVVLPVRPQSRRASVANLLDVLAMVASAFMVVWYLVLGAALQDGVDSVEQALNVAYPLWDLVLILAAGRILLRGTDPRWTVRTRWLVAGALCFVVADVGFGYLSSLDGFTGGDWLDLFWIGAMLCFTLGATSRARTPVTPRVARHTHLLPVLAVVAGYAVVAQVAVDLPFFPLGGVLLVALVITLVVVVRQVVAVTEHRDLAERYRRAAVTDALTGADSRNHFLDQADAELARHGAERCAVIMIDIDHFKTVNDLQGHLAGDTALVAVADHLRRTTRAQDLVGRFGGDEFVALLTDLAVEDAASVVARITDVDLQVGERRLSLSVGWSTNGSTHAGGLQAMLARADTALYAAKEGGRGRAVAAHDLVASPDALRGARPSPCAEPEAAPGLSAAPGVPERLRRELRAAIDHDQLTLHYQPKIDVRAARVCGVEALVRWSRSDTGLRYPDTFIPQMEEAGLMPALTDHVLAMALDQVTAWRHDGLLPLPVSVNLSASSVTDAGLPGRILSALAARGLPGEALLLEITEQCLIDDRGTASQVLGELRERGVRISIDDFGTGWSSLAYLRDLPVDELKLDRAFIAPVADDARAAALVSSTIELSHALGVPMVAEGVEDRTTYDELARFGCDMVQGYLVARPMPAEHFAHWLRTTGIGAAVHLQVDGE